MVEAGSLKGYLGALAMVGAKRRRWREAGRHHCLGLPHQLAQAKSSPLHIRMVVGAGCDRFTTLCGDGAWRRIDGKPSQRRRRPKRNDPTIVYPGPGEALHLLSVVVSAGGSLRQTGAGVGDLMPFDRGGRSDVSRMTHHSSRSLVRIHVLRS